MATEEDAVGLHGGDGAGGADGSVPLHQNHSGHITGGEASIFRARRGGAALSGDEAVILDLRRELLQCRGLKAGKKQGGFDGGGRGAGGKKIQARWSFGVGRE